MCLREALDIYTDQNWMTEIIEVLSGGNTRMKYDKTVEVLKTLRRSTEAIKNQSRKLIFRR